MVSEFFLSGGGLFVGGVSPGEHEVARGSVVNWYRGLNEKDRGRASSQLLLKYGGGHRHLDATGPLVDMYLLATSVYAGQWESAELRFVVGVPVKKPVKVVPGKPRHLRKVLV